MGNTTRLTICFLNYYYYYFGDITYSGGILLCPTTLPCHSWYSCVVEPNDVIIGQNTCVAYFTSRTSPNPGTSCVHVHGNRGSVPVQPAPTGRLGSGTAVHFPGPHASFHMTDFSMQTALFFLLNSQCECPLRRSF